MKIKKCKFSKYVITCCNKTAYSMTSRGCTATAILPPGFTSGFSSRFGGGGTPPVPDPPGVTLVGVLSSSRSIHQVSLWWGYPIVPDPSNRFHTSEGVPPAKAWCTGPWSIVRGTPPPVDRTTK